MVLLNKTEPLVIEYLKILIEVYPTQFIKDNELKKYFIIYKVDIMWEGQGFSLHIENQTDDVKLLIYFI